jgi:hypothetical protein
VEETMIFALDHEITRAITIGGYIFFVLFATVFWLITRRDDSKVASVGQMIERIMHKRTTRIAIMIAWWWVGYHFLVNVVHR